jgi:hypothetical protein
MQWGDRNDDLSTFTQVHLDDGDKFSCQNNSFLQHDQIKIWTMTALWNPLPDRIRTEFEVKDLPKEYSKETHQMLIEDLW